MLLFTVSSAVVLTKSLVIGAIISEHPSSSSAAISSVPATSIRDASTLASISSSSSSSSSASGSIPVHSFEISSSTISPSASVTASSELPEPSTSSINDPASLVNVFIGTGNGGNVFPGATVPHGMIKVGMDTESGGNAGYDPNVGVRINGFSQMHDDGTGGSIPLSLFKLWPFASCGSDDTFESCPVDVNSRKVMRMALSNGGPDEFAEPGYYATNLTTNIRVEHTATRRTALHRYTFPAGIKNPRMLVDITNDGQVSTTDPFLNIDPHTGRVTGGGHFAGSFGPGRYHAFTCVDFKGDGFELGAPAEYGAYTGNSPIKQSVTAQQMFPGHNSELGALLTFEPQPTTGLTAILARVGVSLISTEQACSNAQEEIPDFDFQAVRSAARSEWNDLLGRFQVKTDGVDSATVTLLYSSVYRTHISPADYTGENPLWNSTEPYYDSFYCNWDTFRTLYSLMALHDPVNFARIVRGMINIQQHEGWLPECRGATVQQFIQGGSDGDPILGEFFVKFHEHAASLNVSGEALYTALLADAENQPPNWDLQGRQVDIWKQIGYIPQDVWEPSGTNTRQVSRTLEYAYNDFAVSQVAKILNKADDGAKYAKRAGNFVNVWNPNTTVPNQSDVVGMMQPRFLNGTFGFTDPRHCSVNDPTHSTCFLFPFNTDGFYESSPIVYSQYVPQDTAKLVELQGGDAEFISRLDFIFNDNYFDSTDEPSQQIPFMYHYANRPGLSTQRSRQVISQFFGATVDGLPGNDDSGAMASYVVFYLAGLYPVPATRQFLLSSPYFPEITFNNPLFSKPTTIRANGFVGNPANGTGGTVFVKNVTIDGTPWKSNCFLEWDAFLNGSLIELELTDDINVTCGDAPDALPPSLSTGGFD